MKRIKRVGEIREEETEKALELWIQNEQSIHMDDKKFRNLKKQLVLFTDERGILRLRGRLENSHLSHDAKHPILLNRNSYFTKLVIRHAHITVKHMRVKSTLNEVRSLYWICQGRQTVK